MSKNVFLKRDNNKLFHLVAVKDSWTTYSDACFGCRTRTTMEASWRRRLQAHSLTSHVKRNGLSWNEDGTKRSGNMNDELVPRDIATSTRNDPVDVARHHFAMCKYPVRKTGNSKSWYRSSSAWHWNSTTYFWKYYWVQYGENFLLQYIIYFSKTNGSHCSLSFTKKLKLKQENVILTTYLMPNAILHLPNYIGYNQGRHIDQSNLSCPNLK
jgi:hypothetical protein